MHTFWVNEIPSARSETAPVPDSSGASARRIPGAQIPGKILSGVTTVLTMGGHLGKNSGLEPVGEESDHSFSNSSSHFDLVPTRKPPCTTRSPNVDIESPPESAPGGIDMDTTGPSTNSHSQNSDLWEEDHEIGPDHAAAMAKHKEDYIKKRIQQAVRESKNGLSGIN